MQIKLNGWQRLWVFIITINLLFTALIIFLCIPRKSEIIENWLYATVQSVPILQNQSLEEIKEKYGNTSDKKLIKIIHEKYSYSDNSNAPFNPFMVGSYAHSSVLETIDKEYEKKMESLLKDQFEIIGIWTLWWIISSLAIYAIGWSIGWIYRGFKN